MTDTSPFQEFLLGQIIELKYGKGLPERDRSNTGFPVYGSGGIVGAHSQPLVEGPGIIVGRKGSIGSVYFENRSFFPIDTVYYVVPNKTLCDLKYVYYLLTTVGLEKLNSDAAVPGLNRNIALSQKVKIPSLSMQRRIASILSAYDDLIENNTRRIRILEEMAQAVYREWFVHFRYPGHESVPLVESELGMIPQGWEVKAFTDFIGVLSGGTPKTSNPDYWGGEIPWFTPQDLSGNFYVLDTIRKITELGLSKCSSKLYPPNTVFITARGTVGKCVLASVPMAMSQTNYALLANDGTSQFFVFLLTKSLVEHLKQQATGAVFDTIVVDTFRKLLVIKPHLDIIQKFHAIISPIFELIENLQKKNSNLRQQRDLLLPRLVSGELDVEKNS